MGRRRRLLLGALVVGVVVVQHWLHRAAVSQAPARDVSWVASPEFEEAVRARDAALAARDEATRVVAARNREALAAAVAAKRPAARAPSAPPAAAAAVLVGVASQFAEIAGLKLASIPVARGGTKPATPPDRRGDDARARATAACFGNATRPPEPAAGRLWVESQGARRLLFVHIPKCGGSALTAALRRFACVANGPKSDCCENPGFCQRAKPKPRLCQALVNCHGHQPSLRMYAARPSTRNIRAVTMVREPLGRVVSAWHYRCHNPNWDCFHVPGATQWSERKRADEQWHLKPPNATHAGYASFADFLDMPHYQNVQVRMLGKDRFPYDAAPVVADDVFAAIDVATRTFAVVGVFELFDHSVALLGRLAGVPLVAADFERVRAQHSPQYGAFAAALAADDDLARRAFDANRHDATLHVWAASTLCGELRNADLLDLPGCGAAAAARARAYCADA